MPLLPPVTSIVLAVTENIALPFFTGFGAQMRINEQRDDYLAVPFLLPNRHRLNNLSGRDIEEWRVPMR
jgi:hypothetical protein